MKKKLTKLKNIKVLKKGLKIIKWILFISMIVMIITIFVILIFKNRDLDLINKLFFNKDDEFQWIGVTAIIAIFSFLFTAINNSKKNRQDLVSKSRIEWIQKVREDTAEYISGFYNVFQDNDIDIIELVEKKERLKLFFGHEVECYIDESTRKITLDRYSNTIDIPDHVREILLKMNSNKGKNKYIIEYIDVLYEYYSDIDFKSYKLQKRKYEEKALDFQEKLLSSPDKSKVIIEHGTHYKGNILYHFIEDYKIIDPDLKKEDQDIDRQLKKLQLPESDFVKNQEFLNLIIRLYLKIEWNKAKMGK